MIELAEEITSFVDNEIKDKEIANRLGRLILKDRIIRDEYFIQKSVKQIICVRFSNDNNHTIFLENLNNNILNKIKKNK